MNQRFVALMRSEAYLSEFHAITCRVRSFDMVHYIQAIFDEKKVQTVLSMSVSECCIVWREAYCAMKIVLDERLSS